MTSSVPENKEKWQLPGLSFSGSSVPHPGVSWHQGAQQWHAQCRVAGANRFVDHSEKELERTFKRAVAWRKKQEKERAQAKKPKAPPVKKQRKCRK
eukprot:Skav214992  [mRNA]  locus=scaffold508:550435:550883:- [translate_table: standard]